MHELTEKQIRAISALLAEPTTAAAAKAASVSQATIFRWLAEPGFSQAYRQARNDLLTDTLKRLQAASGAAVDTLRGILTSDEAKPSEKVSAARSILEFSLKAQDAIETNERLAALEQKFSDIHYEQQRETK